MNQEITLDDYKNIGTMDKALSDHADEAFFELSPEQQKIAEKIFKCLTETDSENREIRRAMTVEKLCAVAEADLKQVTDVIDVFRKEGRTFLMPPVEEVEPGALRENSLIDISHESLIRKWERLKNWVEQEGQSARLYRRLAEDALLNKQQKMGFWSDPELKDALEWRAQFNPNATWATLYKETGTRQFKASFDESMNYLDASKANQEAEIADDELQRSRLKKYANRLALTVIGLFFLLLMSVAAAGFAWYQRAAANRINAELIVEKTNVENSRQKLQETANRLDLEKRDKDKAYDDLKLKTDDLNQKTDELEIKEIELSDSLERQKQATERAEEQKKRAELSEAEKQKALEREKLLAEEAQKDRDFAQQKQLEAEAALKQATATSTREEINRSALVFLEQGELKRALPEFEKLLTHYEDRNEQMTAKSRIDGKWWALHNLGIAYSKQPLTFPDRFTNAKCSYIKALGVLGENPRNNKCPKLPPQDSARYFQQPGDLENDEEIMRSKVTTLRRLAQIYREQAENTTNKREARELNVLAVNNYSRLLEILPKEVNYQKEPVYPADVSVEMAGALYDLKSSLNAANQHFLNAVRIYKEQKDFIRQVATLKKWSDAALKLKQEAFAIRQLDEAILIQENEMKLSPVNSELAESYTDLASIYNNLPTESQAPETLEKVEKYNNLSRILNNLSFQEDKSPDRSDTFKIFNDFEKLAEAYVEVGKCSRAELTYNYAKNQYEAPDALSFEELHFLSRLGRHFHKVRDNKQQAQIIFEQFVGDYDEFRLSASNDYSGGDKYETVADFYFEEGDFEKAKRFYEHAQSANQVLLDQYMASDADDEKKLAKVYSLKQVQATVKKAAVLEKINTAQSLQEAEAELLRLTEAKPNFTADQIEKSLVFVYLGDFYDRRGDKTKAAQSYLKADSAINRNLPTAPALLARTTKKLLEFKPSLFTRLTPFQNYNSVLNRLDAYAKDLKGFKGATEKEYARYSVDGQLTLEFYIDRMEILEALVKLPNSGNPAELKKQAEDARRDVENMKTQEAKSLCKH